MTRKPKKKKIPGLDRKPIGLADTTKNLMDELAKRKKARAKARKS